MTSHGFLNAMITAWSSHYAIEISPIDIWILILQAVSTHVEKNAQSLRNKWVNHEGKKELNVKADFSPGNINNDWASFVSNKFHLFYFIFF